MKKILVKIVIVLLIAIASVGLIITQKGYNMYKQAIEVAPLEVKIQEIKSKDNYTMLDEMPGIYKEAVIAVEDHRFYKHKGIDIIAIGRAIFNDIRTLSFAEGGSTITQQLAKNTYFTQEKEVTRKVAEVFMAFEIESKCPKELILELYLNTSYFGDGYETVKEASKGYFEKEPLQLTDYEATMLAGIPNAPSVYAPTKSLKLARQRQNQVLDKMVEHKYISIEKKNDILKMKNN